MIVRDIMTTQLVTIEPDDTVGSAISLFRQHRFHHLPVARCKQSLPAQRTNYTVRQSKYIFMGLLTTQDIDMAAALAQQEEAKNTSSRNWQEQFVVEIMQPPPVYVAPTTSVAAAARLLVEQGLNCLPVVESDQDEDGMQDVLMGLITRSDLLLALAHLLGADEPGTQMVIPLPTDGLTPLTRALQMADELHMHIHSVVMAPPDQHMFRSAYLRLGTIHPAPFLQSLEKEGIHYIAGHSFLEVQNHD